MSHDSYIWGPYYKEGIAKPPRDCLIYLLTGADSKLIEYLHHPAPSSNIKGLLLYTPKVCDGISLMTQGL